MLAEEIIYSPVICYKILKRSENDYGLKVYYDGSEDKKEVCYVADSVCESKERIKNFVMHIAKNCVLPENMKEIIEDFLQMN